MGGSCAKESPAEAEASADAVSAPAPRQSTESLSSDHGSGHVGPLNPSRRASLETRLKGKSTMLTTCDGILLDALWCVPDYRNGSAVLIFHGHGQTLEDMETWAHFYLRRGCHVLLATMRGYPGSSGNGADSGEPGMYRDATAAVDFVAEQGFEASHILAHGLSLGGSLAAAAALHHNLAALTLDHTFTTPQEVAVHATRGGVMPKWLVTKVVGGTVPVDLEVDLGHGRVVLTDGLNTLEKVGEYRGSLFVMYGLGDEFMPTSFAGRFLQARYNSTGATMETCRNAVALRGGHTDQMFHEDTTASLHYIEYLMSLRSPAESVKDCFRQWDTNGDGSIDEDELLEALLTLSPHLSEDQIVEMFRDADLNKDGKIDYLEFVNWVFRGVGKSWSSAQGNGAELPEAARPRRKAAPPKIELPPLDGDHFIKVTCITGEVVSLTVNPTDTITIVKARLSQAESGPLEGQRFRLIFEGKDLIDTEVVEGANLGRGAQVMAVLLR